MVSKLNTLGESLASYRRERKLTQKDLAERLGITQVHVSRIEKGTDKLSKNLEARIISMIGDTGSGFDLGYEAYTNDKWSFVSFVYGGNSSGDRVRLNDKAMSSKTVCFHCDSAGHDIRARYMSDYCIMGLEASIASTNEDMFCTPEFLYKTLDKTIRNTKEYWRGEPSANFFVLNKESGRVDILNAGMPNILYVKKGVKQLQKLSSKKWAPVGALKKRDVPFSEVVDLSEGDVLFSFSDGFIEEFERHSSLGLSTHILSISKALKGDAESIGAKLLKTLSSSLRGSKIGDNISFLIVSKNKES